MSITAIYIIAHMVYNTICILGAIALYCWVKGMFE